MKQCKLISHVAPIVALVSLVSSSGNSAWAGSLNPEPGERIVDNRVYRLDCQTTEIMSLGHSWGPENIPTFPMVSQGRNGTAHVRNVAPLKFSANQWGGIVIATEGPKAEHRMIHVFDADGGLLWSRSHVEPVVNAVDLTEDGTAILYVSAGVDYSRSRDLQGRVSETPPWLKKYTADPIYLAGYTRSGTRDVIKLLGLRRGFSSAGGYGDLVLIGGTIFDETTPVAYTGRNWSSRGAEWISDRDLETKVGSDDRGMFVALGPRKEVRRLRRGQRPRDMATYSWREQPNYSSGHVAAKVRGVGRNGERVVMFMLRDSNGTPTAKWLRLDRRGNPVGYVHIPDAYREIAESSREQLLEDGSLLFMSFQNLFTAVRISCGEAVVK